MQVQRVWFATVVAVSLFSAGGASCGKDGHAPRSATKIASTCIPTGAAVEPGRLALTGATFGIRCVDPVLPGRAA